MIISTPYSPLLVLATLLLCLRTCSEAFQIPAILRHVTSSSGASASTSTPQITRTQKTQIHNIFGNLFGQESKPEGGNDNSAGADDIPVVDVINIPAKVIKTKPIKFFLQLFLVGIQNLPFKGAWLMNANDEVEEYLEVYYADGTGMISIQFDGDYGLRIQRKGKRPSLQYMLQESVLLHSVLDELEAIAFGEGDGDVNDDERLLQFSEENANVLSDARAKLPARAAPEE